MLECEDPVRGGRSVHHDVNTTRLTRIYWLFTNSLPSRLGLTMCQGFAGRYRLLATLQRAKEQFWPPRWENWQRIIFLEANILRTSCNAFQTLLLEFDEDSRLCTDQSEWQRRIFFRTYYGIPLIVSQDEISCLLRDWSARAGSWDESARHTLVRFVIGQRCEKVLAGEFLRYKQVGCIQRASNIRKTIYRHGVRTTIIFLCYLARLRRWKIVVRFEEQWSVT